MTLVQSKSCELIASNDDLLTLILLHLPFKSIARFKSVSKHWLSLISATPRFALPKPALALLLHHPTDPSHLDLLHLHRNETTPHISHFRPLPFFNDPSLRCIHSCNGLLLCSQRMITSYRVYYVYNPTTNQYSTLPPISPRLDDSLPYANLAYDPPGSPYYKVVCFRLVYLARNTLQLAIYSSETREWSLSRDFFMLPLFPYKYKKGVFWNSAIHWINRKGSYRFQVLEKKILDNPMLPITNSCERQYKYFGVSMDRLYLINVADVSGGHLNVYEMENDFSCWCLKHRLDIGNDLGTSFPEIIWRDPFHNYSIMFLAQSNDDDELFLVIQTLSSVVRYNFKSRTYHKIYDLSAHQSGTSYRSLIDIGAYQYVESLSSV